ncbi:hypothetical protein Tco_1289895, partial [Tanacetum coccineum]
VMSTPSHFDSETITQTVEAQSSRVPTPLPDDPYVAVRQAHLVDTNTKSEPKEAPLEIEESQPLVSRAPLTDEEFEVLEPSDTRITSSHSSASLDSTVPLSPDHPLAQASPTPTPTRVSFHRRTARMAVRTQPTLSSGMSARIAKGPALSPSSFRKKYRSSYETPSPSSTLPVPKRYKGTSELILDTKIEDESLDSDAEREGLEDEGHGLEDEGHGLEDKGHGLEYEGPAADKPLRLAYEALICCGLAIGEGSVPSTFETPASPEWSSGLLPVSPSSPVVPSPIASLVTTQRPILALEAWAGHVDARRAEMWQARYDDHRLIHDMLVQHAAMQCEH